MLFDIEFTMQMKEMVTEYSSKVKQSEYFDHIVINVKEHSYNSVKWVKKVDSMREKT